LRHKLRSLIEDWRELLERGVEAGVTPGGQLAFGSATSFEDLSFGFTTYGREEPVCQSTRFDLASLTKVVCTTAVAHSLVREGRIELVSIEDLLAHRSGLPAHVRYDQRATSPAHAWELIEAETKTDSGQTVYSCVGFLQLQRRLEAASGQTLDLLFQERIAGPLGLNHTRFMPSAAAPTELGVPIGEPHDENARFLGGVAGNAGLFGTAADLACFAQHILSNLSEWEDWIRPQPPAYNRGLGWDIKESDSGTWSPRTFGHLGFTGCSLWIDPDAGTFVALVTNRVHPSRNNDRIQSLRRLIDLTVFSELNR